MSNLLIAGDSFSVGAECEHPRINRWSTVLAKKLKLHEVNVGISGASNEQNLRNLLLKISTEPPAMLVMLWTFPSRHELMLNYEINGSKWVETTIPLKKKVKYDVNDKHQEWHWQNNEQYTALCTTLFKNTHSEEYNMYLMYKDMLLLQTYCKSLNIRYVPLYTYQALFEHLYKYQWVNDLMHTLDPFVLFDGMGYVDWCKHKGYKFGEFEHPMDEANIAAGEYLHNILST